jgi:rod shape determining protein RodA
MTARQLWRNFDWPLFIVVLILSGIGVSMIYSATANTVDLNDLWLRQLVLIGVGLLALFAVALFDYRHLELLAPLAYLTLVGLLVAVAFVGETQGTGTRRWLNLGGTLVQPTESGKFLLIIFFAWYLSWYRQYMTGLPYLLIALTLLLGPLYLIFRQPDLGTTMNFAFLGGALILISGVPFWQLGLLVGVLVASVPLLLGSLQDYMVERIDIFLNPEQNRAATYNIEQALIAIGGGGWLGQGWAHGSQNQLHFLRVRHTDFIFSVIAEELGLIGTSLIVALLLYVIWRILNIADRAQDPFGRLIAVGVAALIFFQTVVSVGMNLNLLPVTGLPLPFVSYGGSSLISMMIAVGLAQSVGMRHRKIEFLT